MSFYFAIILFISSVIVGVVLMIMNKGAKRDRFMLLATAHGLLLLAFVATKILQHPVGNTIRFNYIFMFFICSGVMLAGLAWRAMIPKFLKVYFAIFVLTIPMFFFSPSRLVYFLLTSKYTDNPGPSFAVGNNYFLVYQATVMMKDSIPHYKMVRKKGIYYQTIRRDITFGGAVDSIHVLNLVPGSSVLLRGYTSKVTYVSTEVDSLDMEVILSTNKINDIEYRL